MKKLLLILGIIMACCCCGMAQNAIQLKGTWQLVRVEEVSQQENRSIKEPEAITLRLKSRHRLGGNIALEEMPGWYWGKLKYKPDGTVKKVKAMSDYPYYIRDRQKKWDVDLYLSRLRAVKKLTLTDSLLVLHFEGNRFGARKGTLVFQRLK